MACSGTTLLLNAVEAALKHQLQGIVWRPSTLAETAGNFNVAVGAQAGHGWLCKHPRVAYQHCAMMLHACTAD